MTDSFLEKLNRCRKTVKLQRRADEKTIVINRYDLWQQKFSVRDLKENLGKSLIKQYQDKLLVPLFQNNPLYSKVNRVAGSVRFTSKVCQADFSDKFTGKNPETIFILISDPESQIKPIGELIGDISIFAVDPIELYKTKLSAGAIGVMANDRIKLLSDFPTDYKRLKCAYFNGIGVAENFQNLGVGVYLLYQALKELERRRFDVLITRVMKKAKNYRLMSRLSDEIVLTYSSARFGNDYRAVFSSPVKTMLIKLNLELKRKFYNFEELL